MKNPFITFDNIYCLNLESRKDRWGECLSNFEKYEINKVEKFLAFDPPDSYGLTGKRKGQFGCSYSFCNIFQDIKDKGYNSVLLLEDDFNFSLEKEDLFECLNKCLDELPENWDMFYLGANVMDEIHRVPLQNYSNNLLRLFSAYTLHSVAISKKAIEKITSEINWRENILNNYENMDVFLAKDFQIKNNCFISKHILATQRPDFSSIEGTFYNYQELIAKRFNFFKNNCEN